MILHNNNRINYSLFNSTVINSKMRNRILFKNFYFKINYVSQEPFLITRSCHASKFISKISEKKVNSFILFPKKSSSFSSWKSFAFPVRFFEEKKKDKGHDWIKNKNLIPDSNKNFKVYFLFMLFYFDKIRSNILSASLLYNSFINKGIKKVDKPFQCYINNGNGLHCNEFKTEERKGYYIEEKYYKNTNILNKFGNNTRPIHFFKILKKNTTSLLPTKNKSDKNFVFSTLKTLYHYSFNFESFINFSDSFIYKRVKLIRFLQSAKLLLQFLRQKKQSLSLICATEQEKHIKINVYKKSFINCNLVLFKIIINNIINSEIKFKKKIIKSSLILFHLFLINLIETNLNQNRNSFQYENKLQKVKIESSANQFIWYCKFKQTKVIYIFKEVLILLNSAEQDCRRQGVGSFWEKTRKKQNRKK